jgi:hypothetical protein
MISEAAQYHGVVLRQLVVSSDHPVTIALADSHGRPDCFRINRAAIQIKYSTRRLSPWQFSFTIEQLQEMESLAKSYRPVWLMLVCGVDGIVALSSQEFVQITEGRPGGVATVRVSRKRNAMYRVSGNASDLPFAKSRGVEDFLTAINDGDASVSK